MKLINRIQSLHRLSPSASDWLESRIQSVEFKKNTVLVHAGEVCHNLYYINSGLLCGFYFAEGNEVCNWIASEGDFATSYYSFVSGKPGYETIQCFENCKLEQIAITDIKELYRLHPESEKIGRLILEDYYLRAEERFISIQFKSAKERYLYLLEKRPEIVRRAPIGKIATYLGMKLETLSRLRSEVL
ncbi:MAG: Crp/Fnr family transcriptional regulator [Crocinitomicaceae bacterium]|nr:Crp/Fnr family transcriptional regulator [Crocinitomicaceae bacterium]